MKTVVAFAISLSIFFQMAAQSQLDLYPNFNTLGVNVVLSPADPEGDAWADLEYRVGNGQFTPGSPAIDAAVWIPGINTPYFVIGSASDMGALEGANVPTLQPEMLFSLQIYPTVNDGEFWIDGTNLTENEGALTIFDLAGRQAFSQNVYFSNGRCQINLENSPGWYVVRLEAGGQIFTGKTAIGK